MFVLQVFSFISCLSQPWSKLVPCSPTVFSVVCFLLFTSGVCVCVICRSVVSSEFVHVKSCCRVLLSAHDCPLTLKCWFNSGIKLLFISLVLVLFEQRVHDDIIVVSAMRSSSLLQWCHHHYCSNDVIIICGDDVIIIIAAMMSSSLLQQWCHHYLWQWGHHTLLFELINSYKVHCHTDFMSAIN